MKEIWLHADSKVCYASDEQQFIYVAEEFELVLFDNHQITLENGIQCQDNSCMLLEKYHIYTFHVPAQGMLLFTKLSLASQSHLYRFYSAPFQNEEIASLCIMLAEYRGLQSEKLQLLYTSQMARLTFLVLNLYCYSLQEKIEVSKEDKRRMVKIHELITTHMKETFTLTMLADLLHLTPQYVSMMFKTMFGCTFLHYLNHVRLEAAIQDIQTSHESSLTIAMRYGFANVRSFQTIFFKIYGCTPKQYRKQLSLRNNELSEYQDSIVTQFLQRKLQSIPMQLDEYQQHDELHLSGKAATVLLHHTWRNLMTVGRARLLLIDDIRRQLAVIQEEIGFRMIRFHGIFNDDMHVYDEDELGNVSYNFQHVNEVLDYLQRMGLKPFIELGFMPYKLARNPEMTILNRMFIVSPPKSIMKWQGLLQAFLRNCINRYGLDEVTTWYFEFWNNGGLDNEENDAEEIRKLKFWQTSVQEYMALYQATYQAVKKVHPLLRIGGPSIDVSLLSSHPKACSNFISFMKKQHCMIDFLTMHIYPYQSSSAIQQNMIEPSSFQEAIEQIQSWMKRNKLEMELHITEWSTWGYEHRGFHDGCGKALYMIKSIIDSYDQYQTLGHWTFSDYTETMKTKANHIFSDHVGLFTSNGIKKAAYQAYVLLHKLGDELLEKGENYIFTRKQKHYQLLLFHYKKTIHPCSQQIQITLDQIANGTYEKKLYRLNSSSGSAYDIWKQMGSHEEMMEEDVAYLKAHAMMSYTREVLQIQHHSLCETQVLQQDEALLIEWIYKY